MIKTITITQEQARRFLVTYQHLNGNELDGDDGIISYIEQVGCIQYDPLNVVGRNADLVLQSRISNYRPAMLEGLLYQTRALMDGWDKMMSIYQQKDWPYFTRIREAMKEDIRSTLAYRNSLEALELVDEIHRYILDNGPTQAKDIKIGASYAGSWGHKKMSSAALDYMYHIGMIGVHTKKNTQKVYDVIEKIILTETLGEKDPFQDSDDFDAWYIQRRIGSIGLLWGKSGGGWLGYHLYQVPLRKKGLDNLLWDRSMIEQLFKFSYTWEVYVPPVKRKYGYYVLPVLYGQQFIARFEPELQRKKEPLRIKHWWWEKDVVVTTEMQEAIAKGLECFCEYLGAEGYVIMEENGL